MEEYSEVFYYKCIDLKTDLKTGNELEEKSLNKTQLILMKYLQGSCANPGKKTGFWKKVSGL
jgi:hypothetical protein